MQKWIVGVAIAGAIACLLIYIAMSVTAIVLSLRAGRAEQDGDGTKKGGNKTFTDPAALVEAIGKLVEALAKAGPVLWALIGSMLFLLIAGFAAGLFKIG